MQLLDPWVTGHMWGHKPYPLGINQVRQVKSKVYTGEDCDHDFAVPRTLPLRTRRRPPRGPVLGVEAKDWPHHWGAQVEEDFQEGAHHHQLIEGDAAHSLGPFTHGHDDHQRSQSKAESVDNNAVDGSRIAGVLAPVGQGSKDDASYKPLNDFEEPGDSGHVAHHHLAWSGPAQGHLSAVGQSAQDGADRDSDAEISNITAGIRTLGSDKKQGVNHRGCHIPAARKQKKTYAQVRGESEQLMKWNDANSRFTCQLKCVDHANKNRSAKLYGKSQAVRFTDKKKRFTRCKTHNKICFFLFSSSSYHIHHQYFALSLARKEK